MVFIDAGAAHRVQHDVNQVYEAIARLLSKIHLENSWHQPDVIPRIDIEVEEGQKQPVLEGELIPLLSGQEAYPALEGQPDQLQLEGRDFAALPYRDLEPLTLPSRPPLNLDPDEASVLIQLGDAVIERPLKLLPHALEELQPEQIAALRQGLERPVDSTQPLPVNLENTAARIEIEGIERFAIAEGQINVNDLYPEIVGIQAEEIAAGEVNATPEQVENLARYLLDHHAPEQADGQRSLVVLGNQQQITVAEHPEQGMILDFDDLRSNPEQFSTEQSVDLNTAYQLLYKELEQQTQPPLNIKAELVVVSDSPELEPDVVKPAEVVHSTPDSDFEQPDKTEASLHSLAEGKVHQPEMQLRPISEVEAITGQQLGNVEALHHEVLSESPVVLVSVDDLGRPMVTSSVIAHVEVTEDEVETEEIEQTVNAGIVENQNMDLAVLDQLQTFFDQTGVRELESPETGMVIQSQESGLVANTPNGHVLVSDGDRVQTNFTPIEIQQLGEMAQEATLALAANEISSGAVQHFNQEIERG
jgi:hypothetical protein